MQVSTSSFFRNQSDQLQKIQLKLGEVQKDIASGRTVNVPSDDSVAFSDLARLKNVIANIEQAKRNITAATSRLEVEDNALSQAITTLTRVKEQFLYSSNDALNEGDRKAISKEIGLLKDFLLEIANSKDANGASVFGGQRTAENIFVADLNGKVRYLGDDGKIFTEVGNGAEVQVNSSGHESFMKIEISNNTSSKSVFDIVQDGIDSLSKGESPEASLDEIDAAIRHLTQRQTITGTRLTRVQSELDSLTAGKLSTEVIVSSIEDTNIEATVTKLKQQLIVLEAAQASFVKIVDQTLFDYLR